MTEATPNIARTAVLAACADMIRACGLTLAELADELARPAQSAAPMRMLPMAGEVDIDAVHTRRAIPVAVLPAERALTDNDRRIIAAAACADGMTVTGVMQLLSLQEAQAHRCCAVLADARHLVRVKKPGIRAMHFFSRPADALTWAEATELPDPAHQAPPAPFPDPAPAAAPASAALTPAEIRSAEIHAGRIAAAKKSPQPVVNRTERVKAGKENITFSPPKVPPSEARPKGEAITTDKTVETRDTTVRPTAKWQTQDLPPDPRYPSFSSMRPGTDPRTGKAWEQRA